MLDVPVLADLDLAAGARVGVVRANTGALAFWRKIGYIDTGEVARAGPSHPKEVIVLEKTIVR